MIARLRSRIREAWFPRLVAFVLVPLVGAGLLAKVPAWLVGIGGRAVAFLGIALALAALLRDYKYEREKLTRLGVAVSYSGAALILVGGAAEHSGDAWAWAVVVAVLLAIPCLIWFKGTVRGALSHVKLGVEPTPLQVKDEPNSVVVPQEGNGENGDEPQRGADEAAKQRPGVLLHESREP